MSPDLSRAILLVFALMFVLFVASAVQRARAGKPILFFGVSDAEFIEHTASGSTLLPPWRRFLNANGCLVVAVARERLVIRPFFPFNMMFTPELLRLEYDVPVKNVVSATLHRLLGRERVHVVFWDDDGERCEFSALLKDPATFLRLVTPHHDGAHDSARSLH
jgi:hypothetical protein